MAISRPDQFRDPDSAHLADLYRITIEVETADAEHAGAGGHHETTGTHGMVLVGMNL